MSHVEEDLWIEITNGTPMETILGYHFPMSAGFKEIVLAGNLLQFIGVCLMNPVTTFTYLPLVYLIAGKNQERYLVNLLYRLLLPTLLNLKPLRHRLYKIKPLIKGMPDRD